MLDCENRSRPLNFRQIWIYLFFLSWYQILKIWCEDFVKSVRKQYGNTDSHLFLSWHQILKIRCIHEASSVRKLKSSNVLPQKKNFVKSASKQYGNLDSHPFFTLYHLFDFHKYFPFFYAVLFFIIHCIRNFLYLSFVFCNIS